VTLFKIGWHRKYNSNVLYLQFFYNLHTVLIKVVICLKVRYVKQNCHQMTAFLFRFKKKAKNVLSLVLIVQSTAHHTIHFGFCTTFIRRALRLILNCKCIAWRAVGPTLRLCRDTNIVQLYLNSPAKNSPNQAYLDSISTSQTPIP
jgi:hypothetical protein